MDELRERVERLAELVGVGTGHSAHWDKTGGYGAGCPECSRAHAAHYEARDLKEQILALLEPAEPVAWYISDARPHPVYIESREGADYYRSIGHTVVALYTRGTDDD